jgi:hypothetical protein
MYTDVFFAREGAGGGKPYSFLFKKFVQRSGIISCKIVKMSFGIFVGNLAHSKDGIPANVNIRL